MRRYELGEVRHDWRRSEIQKIYDGGLMETIFRAVCPILSGRAHRPLIEAGAAEVEGLTEEQ